MALNILTAIDVETTGAEAGYHEIIALHCIKFNSQTWKILSNFCVKIKPQFENRIDNLALTINGYTKEELKTFTTQSIAKPQFFNWVDNLYTDFIIPVAHDWSFDRTFIEYWLGKEIFDDLFNAPPNPHCTKSMSNLLIQAGVIPKCYPSLINMCDYFNIPMNPNNAHQDVKLLIPLLKNLIKKINQ
ncbi:MAG: 3'-5' exonuclease [Candidatus Helarchaeota archaeon]